MNPIIDDTVTKVTNATTVERSAEELINSISQKIQDAVNAALENGATAEQLQPVADVAAALDTESAALQAAILANTQPPPPPKPQP